MVDRQAPQVERVRCVAVRRRRNALRGPDRRTLERESLRAASGGLEPRERRLVEAAPSRMPHVVAERAERALAPAIEELEAQRVVDAEVRVHAVGRRPGAEAYAADELAGSPRRA